MNSWAATLILAVAVLALILFLIPPLHSVAWIIGLISAVITALGVVGLAYEWSSTQARIDRLGNELTQAYEQSNRVQLTQVEDEPQNPDAEHAARIRSLFPQDTGLVQELRVSQVASLSQESLRALETFLSQSKHASFINRDAHYAFMDLFRTGSALRDWVKQEMAPSDQDTNELVVIPGDTREGGWHEFSRAQNHGENVANSFVTARSIFERVIFENSLDS